MTATAEADYEPVSGSLTFTADRAMQVVAVPVVDDAVDEPEETLTVVLTNVANATIGTAAAVGVIRDDDPVPELGISGGTAAEGETMAFVVTLSGSTARTVTVDYATADGSATAGADYGSVSGTLTFAPRESSATVSVDIVDDETYEPDETFVVRLSSPVNSDIASGEATGTILDDDEEPAAVAVPPENPMLCVGGAPARIDLSRHFSGDDLSYVASDPDPSVATASLGEAVLTSTPLAEGTTSVTVTATNKGSRATFELTITVVADPAELGAVERGLAVAGGVFLADVMDAIGDRFVGADAGGAGSMAARPLDNLPLASGSLAFSAIAHTGAGNWSVWGRGSARRFGDGELLKDGSLTALQAGADVRLGDWRVGAAGVLGRTDAEYGFMRSVDACGGGGAGVLETEILSVHPYVGRRVGRGWLWGTAGLGGGEAVVERCATGHRTAADLSMRMGARHVIRGGQRVEVSLVEDMGVLRAKTEAAMGPVGDQDVSVGRARLGLEARGVCATGPGSWDGSGRSRAATGATASRVRGRRSRWARASTRPSGGCGSRRRCTRWPRIRRTTIGSAAPTSSPHTCRVPTGRDCGSRWRCGGARRERRADWAKAGGCRRGCGTRSAACAETCLSGSVSELCGDWCVLSRGSGSRIGEEVSLRGCVTRRSAAGRGSQASSRSAIGGAAVVAGS